MLPKLDGLSLIQRLREQRIRTPVLILSAQHTVDDRVKGLESRRRRLPDQAVRLLRAAGARAGADPARDAAPPTSTRSTVGDLTLDLLSRAGHARRAARSTLRPREFALLEYLMRNAGRVVSKTMILSHVWDYSFDPGTNVVDVLVFRLREKIDKGFERKMIQTVRGIGYVLQPA